MLVHVVGTLLVGAMIRVGASVSARSAVAPSVLMRQNQMKISWVILPPTAETERT